MGNKRNGLLALLGLGAVAFWKYKKSSPEDQQAVKDKVNAAKDNLNKFTGDLQNKAKDVANQVQTKASEVASQVQHKVETVEEKIDDSVAQN